LSASTTGDEKVTNGKFTAAAPWTYGHTNSLDGWSYDGTNNEADCDGNQTAGVDLKQDISAAASERYKLRYKVKNYVTGTVTSRIGGVDGEERSANGTYYDYITATGTGNLKFQADADFTGSVDTVSVKRIFTGNTIRTTWTNGTTYTLIYILHKTVGSWEIIDTLGGSVTSYEHEGVSTNVLHYYQVQGYRGIYEEPLSDLSNSDSAACWVDTLTEEVAIDESIADYATGSTISDTITETVAVADYVIDAKDIITNYVYYLGTATGGIYEYGGFYKSDAGTAITARWESKDTDFADQSIENSDKFKTVEFVRLHYIDKSAGARISIKVSTDGGASWTTKTKSIGTGNSKGKIKDFYFIKTGQIFRFAIESISTTDEFQWVGLEAFYSLGGDGFAA
jgi:hypothetical protein